MKGMLLFVRSRGGGWVVPLAVLSFAVVKWAPAELVSSPIGATTKYSPVLVWSGLPAAPGYLALRQPGFDMEVGSSFLALVRAVWWGVVSFGLALPGVLAALPSFELGLVIARNTFLLLGIGHWTVRAVGQDFGWLVGTVMIGTTLFFGTTSADGDPAPWAFLLWPVGDPFSWVLAGVVGGSAWLFYSARPVNRPWSRLAN